MTIQKNLVIDIILQSFEENMDQKIKYFDFLFEGFTSDLIEEKNNKKKQKRLKKTVKKPKKNPDGTTSSGRHPGPPQDIWYP